MTKLCAPRQAEPAVYDWLAEMLERLAIGTATAERLRVFEMGLLRALGLQPVVDRCAVCATTDPGGAVPVGPRLRRGRSARAAHATGAPSPPATRAALVHLAGLSLVEADAVSLPADVNRGCREALSEIINQHISGPLKSLEFITKLSNGV